MAASNRPFHPQAFHVSEAAVRSGFGKPQGATGHTMFGEMGGRGLGMGVAPAYLNPGMVPGTPGFLQARNHTMGGGIPGMALPMPRRREVFKFEKKHANEAKDAWAHAKRAHLSWTPEDVEKRFTDFQKQTKDVIKWSWSDFERKEEKPMSYLKRKQIEQVQQDLIYVLGDGYTIWKPVYFEFKVSPTNIGRCNTFTVIFEQVPRTRELLPPSAVRFPSLTGEIDVSEKHEQRMVEALRNRQHVPTYPANQMWPHGPHNQPLGPVQTLPLQNSPPLQGGHPFQGHQKPHGGAIHQQPKSKVERGGSPIISLSTSERDHGSPPRSPAFSSGSSSDDRDSFAFSNSRDRTPDTVFSDPRSRTGRSEKSYHTQSSSKGRSRSFSPHGAREHERKNPTGRGDGNKKSKGEKKKKRDDDEEDVTTKAYNVKSRERSHARSKDDRKAKTSKKNRSPSPIMVISEDEEDSYSSSESDSDDSSSDSDGYTHSTSQSHHRRDKSRHRRHRRHHDDKDKGKHQKSRSHPKQRHHSPQPAIRLVGIPIPRGPRPRITSRQEYGLPHDSSEDERSLWETREDRLRRQDAREFVWELERERERDEEQRRRRQRLQELDDVADARDAERKRRDQRVARAARERREWEWEHDYYR